MPKLDTVETLESQERLIKKQQREIKQLERINTQLNEELVKHKKEQKLKLLEIHNRIKDQSRSIKEFKHQKNIEVRQIKERNIQHKSVAESAETKIKTLQDEIEIAKIENEELMNKITQNSVINLEKDTEMSNSKTQLNVLKTELDTLKKDELNTLQQKILVKSDLLEKQNEAINKLTLDMKKYEVEIAELEFKLSTEQAKHGDMVELQRKIESEEEIIIHLRKTNKSNEETINTLREQLNSSNKRINELLEKLKSPQGDAQSDQKISYFVINFPEE